MENNVVQSTSAPATITQVHVNLQRVIGSTNPEYASWNVDPSMNRGFFHINFTNANLRAAAASLAPSVLRLGGSGADFLEYGLGDAPECPQSDANDTYGCLNETHWSDFHAFSVAAGAKLLFGASFNLRTACTDAHALGSAYVWNASGVGGRGILALLRHAARHKQRIWGLELGNEINNALRPCPVTFGCECGLRSAQQAEAFIALSQALQALTPAMSPQPVLVGPDTGGFECYAEGATCPWLRGVLAALSQKAPGLLHATTHHVYAGLNQANAGTIQVYEHYKIDTAWYLPMVARYAPTAQPWAGENGLHWGGEDGSCGRKPACGTFASALWYADALGARARAGFVQFQRQDLLGGMYGLLGIPHGGEALGPEDAVRIRADFWVNFLWKRLIGTQVLDAELTSKLDAPGNGSRLLRAYAFKGRPPSPHADSGAQECADFYPPACYVLLLINLDTAPQYVKLEGAHATFRLTAGPGGLFGLDPPSLNGATLPEALSDGRPMTSIPAAPVTGSASQPLTVPRQSVVFGIVHPFDQTPESG